MRFYLAIFGLFASGLMWSCSTAPYFKPKSEYPPDPWVKGYSNPDDCLGGEQLAARKFYLPDYPRTAFNAGRQGWVIVRLDVTQAGETENVTIERSVPAGTFDGAAKQAVREWQFEPPKSGPMSDCRVLLRFRLGGVSLGA
ncbi:MAG: energy transducer TonB [Hellea sp.]|nr:energy transducer TonB [Hellea sp.]